MIGGEEYIAVTTARIESYPGSYGSADGNSEIRNRVYYPEHTHADRYEQKSVEQQGKRNGNERYREEKGGRERDSERKTHDSEKDGKKGRDEKKRSGGSRRHYS